MKQDNRERKKTFEEKISVLKDLLKQGQDAPEGNQKETSFKAKREGKNEKQAEKLDEKKQKNVFISVQGDSNIISMGKNQSILMDKSKKKSSLVLVFVCFLFF